MAANGVVLVEVVDLTGGREIGLGGRKLVDLQNRMDSIKDAIVGGAKSTVAALSELPAASGWAVDEVSASFGLTLTAEASVLVSKGSAEACMQVTVTYRRQR